MKAQWLILGISRYYLTFPHLLVRCTEDMIDSHDGKLLSRQGDHLFHGSFNGTLPTAERDGLEPVSFDRYEEAEAFIHAEQAAGSDWNYALWTVNPA